LLAKHGGESKKETIRHLFEKSHSVSVETPGVKPFFRGAVMLNLVKSPEKLV